jgi:hypothetical protein
MGPFKKILILLIIIIFTYVLWRLLFRRRQLQTQTHPIKEGLNVFTTPDSELDSIKNSNPVMIQGIHSDYTNQPIRDYVFKSSYNSAITGNYVNLDMIKYLLGRGCRFLDFEVFSIDNAPVVAYTTDSNFDTIDTDNSILLDTVLSTAVSNAFSQTSPNAGDPLFIHLRIKSNDPNIYHATAKSVDFALKSKLYNKKVSKQTPLSAIMGKVVLIVDKTINRKYKDLSVCSPKENQCYDLSKYANMESGSETLFLQRYSEILNQCTAQPQILDKCPGKHGDACTNITNMRVIIPDLNYKNTQNPEYMPFIHNYGCQMVAYRFYSLDAGLKNYETFFDDNKLAIVPLAYAIRYIKEQNSSA